MKFRIVLLNDSIHTQCFAEVADSVEWALRELGHEVESAVSLMVGNGHPINVVFGLRPDSLTAQMADKLMPSNTIIYNGEQATRASIFPGLVDLYKRFTVWDYSHENSKRYESFGLKTPQVVRPGYCPVLEGRFPQVEKDHDVVFFGSKNERRQRLLDDLRTAGMSVLEVPFGLYGTERDAYLARARVAVNVHFYEDSIFESVRCSYLMHNGIAVVSENSAGVEASAWGISGDAPYDLLVTACRYALQAPMAVAGYQEVCMRQVSLIDDVAAAVEVMDAGKTPASGGEQGLAVSRDGGEQGSGVQVDKRHKITLSMIVKNERDVIERCLASVKPYLTHWCVVDTGSTDGTQEIIRKFMQDVPGELFEREWKEFDGSRTEAIELAQQICGGEGWLLFIDSDEILMVDGQLELPDAWDAYLANVTRCIGCNTWGRPVFAKASKPWFYEMPRHEGLACRVLAPAKPEPLPNVTVLSTFEGARAKEGMYERYLRDAGVLEKWIQSHPGHTRAQYYMSQSYRDAATGKSPPDKGALQKAIQGYLKRADMFGFDQETFSAIYQAARCMNSCGWPWERIQGTMMRAFAYRPSRPEPLEDIALHYLAEKQWALAELFARKAASIPMTTDAFPDVDRAVYQWLAKDTLATALTYLNGHEEALAIFEEILPIVPGAEHRIRVLQNIAMCRRHLGLPILQQP